MRWRPSSATWTDVNGLIEPADPRSDAARWCIAQYFAELGERFEGGFDHAISLAAVPDQLMLPAGLFRSPACARRRSAAARSSCTDASAAEVKRMWVSPTVRGLGVGRRMLRELERGPPPPAQRPPAWRRTGH